MNMPAIIWEPIPLNFISHNKVKTEKLANELNLNTILDAWGWCTGTTQRDGMGREEGGGFRMGNTCVPVADSF